MPQTEASLPTREKIVSSAQRLFLQYGFTAVGINRLCHEAGVVKGSFYHFFPSKDVLLDAVIERNRQELLGKLKAPASESGNGRDQVLAQFATIMASAAEQKLAAGRILGCTIGTLANELAGGNDSVRTASADAFRQWQSVLQDAVRAGVEDGSISQTVDPAATAVCLLAVIQGMSTLGRSFDDAEMLAVIAQTSAKRLLPVRLY